MSIRRTRLCRCAVPIGMIPDANAIGRSPPRTKQRHAVLWSSSSFVFGSGFGFTNIARPADAIYPRQKKCIATERGDQGPSHPTQNVTKALFGLILWRNDGWIPFLLRTLLCLCGEYEMSTPCYVHNLLVCLFSDALTRILRLAILCPTKVSAALNRNRFSVFSALCFEI